MANFPTSAVLLLGLPAAALAGIDLIAFTTTPRFLGVRELPSGLHFVFTSANSSLSLRHGVWFRVWETRGDNAPQTFVYKWRAATEDLGAESNQETLHWRANLGSIWQDRLTPYRQRVPTTAADGADASQGQITVAEDEIDEQEPGHEWGKLTSHVTDGLLERITGGPRDHWILSTASSAKRDMDSIPGLSQNESFDAENELNFLPIDLKRTWRAEATGRERTEAARDRSWALGDIVQRYASGEQGVMDIIGEMQVCFIAVLTLNNYSCLEQWKRILELVLTCTEAVKRWPAFFVGFISTLQCQLQHCQDAEGGLIDLSDEGATLLKGLLRRFKRGLNEMSGKEKSEVMDELEELEDFLKTQHGWQLNDSFVRHGMLELEDGEQVEMDFGGNDEDDETGEYAPVVVEMPQADSAGGKRAASNLGELVSAEDEEDEQDLEDMDSRY